MAEKKEKKDEEKNKKAEKKVFDENDEAFIGFCSIQQLDGDGIAPRTRGSSIDAPMHIVSAEGADPVVMEACFNPSDPLFYCELRQEDGFYVFGHFWMNTPKYSATNNIATLTPAVMQDCHKKMDNNTFQATAICPFVKDAPSKPLKVTITTEEKKFKCKFAKVQLQMPRAVWMEYKAYKVRMWKSGKNWAGQEKDDDDKEGKEDGEKKDE